MITILMTGAAGIVGTMLRPIFATRYDRVVLADIDDITTLSNNETFHRGDIADLEFVNRIVAGVDGIVHLAGLVGPDFTFDQVLQANIVGTHNVFAAAKAQGVANVVFASSHHSIGFMRRGQRIDETTAPRPDSQYGLSKAFGEAAGAYYADKYGLNVLAIRIGYVGDKVVDERRLHTWTSARDLAQLIEIGLVTSNLGYEVVYGVSKTPEPFFDNSNARRLGYQPQDRAVDHLVDAEILNHRPDLDSIEGSCVGGPFPANGYVRR